MVSQGSPLRRQVFVPIAIVLGLSGLSLGITVLIRQHRDELLRLETARTAEQLAIRLEGSIASGLNLVTLVRDHWALDEVSSEAEFREHVGLIMKRCDGLLAINWIDPHGVIRWVEPEAVNRPARGKDLTQHRIVAPLLEAARNRGTALLSPPLTLFQGGRGFVGYLPLPNGSGPAGAGFLNPVFRTAPLIDRCLTEGVRVAHAFAIREGQSVIYQHGDHASAEGAPYRVSRDLRVGQRSWTVELQPGPRLLAATSTTASDVAGVLGVLTALALGWLVGSYLRAGEARTQAEKLRADLFKILEGTPDLIGMAGANGLTTYLNAAARRTLIPPGANPVGCAIADFRPPRAAQHTLGTVIPTAIREGFWQGESVIYNADREERLLAQIVIAHMKDGELEFVSMIGRDITEEKAREREREGLLASLQQKQKLETIGTLAGGIAHDFNNSLAAILGLAEVASADPRNSPGVTVNLAKITRAGQHAKDLVAQILTFARRTEYELQTVSIDRVVGEAVDFLRSILPASVRVEVERELDDWTVSGDATQLRQVVVNLVQNGAHAMQDRGTVSVSTRLVEVGDELTSRHPELTAGTHACVTVSDRGQGMSPETLARIFDPFFTTKEVNRGTGLGLSVVHGIVRGHQGCVIAESSLGEGTQFRVLLPCSSEAEAVAEAEAEAVAEAEPEAGAKAAVAEPVPAHVLLVDDARDVREVYAILLRRAGYRVTTSASGEDALRIVGDATRAIDVVLTDLTMPGMSGMELGAALHAQRPELPLVLLTGYVDVDEAEFRAHGFVGLLQKPFSGDDLVGCVRKLSLRVAAQ